MEEFYYQKMDRQKQAVYHGMLQGVRQLADQIQLPRVDGKELYDIFFQMRLDHPEIFWVVGFSWKYYPDSPNLIFVPEYLFEKGKIKEHQIALTSRVEKLARQAQGLSVDLSAGSEACENRPDSSPCQKRGYRRRRQRDDDEVDA